MDQLESNPDRGLMLLALTRKHVFSGIYLVVEVRSFLVLQFLAGVECTDVVHFGRFNSSR